MIHHLAGAIFVSRYSSLPFTMLSASHFGGQLSCTGEAESIVIHSSSMPGNSMMGSLLQHSTRRHHGTGQCRGCVCLLRRCHSRDTAFLTRHERRYCYHEGCLTPGNIRKFIYRSFVTPSLAGRSFRLDLLVGCRWYPRWTFS